MILTEKKSAPASIEIGTMSLNEFPRVIEFDMAISEKVVLAYINKMM